jgi:hypothetical protein
MSTNNRREGETEAEYAERLGFGDNGDDGGDSGGDSTTSTAASASGGEDVQAEATEAFREAGATTDSPSPDDQTAAADPTADSGGGGGIRNTARDIAGGVRDAFTSLTGGTVSSSEPDRDRPNAEERATEGVETLRDTGTTSAEADTATGIETLRSTGTPSGERRDLGRARDEPFGDPAVPVIDEVAGRDPGARLSRRGRQIGRRIGRDVGGALGGTVDTAGAVAANPEDVVDVRSGPVQSGDEGFRVSASLPDTDGGAETAGQAFGGRVTGFAGSLPGEAVSAVDESAELGIAAGQEAPGLVDIRSGPIRSGDRGFRIEPDVADESRALTDALAVTGGRTLRGVTEGAGLRVNPDRAQQGTAGESNLLGERASRAIADTRATVFADDRDETGPVIERDPDVSPEEAFGRLTGGAATVGASVAAGTAATRGLQAASRRGRGFARRRRADVEIDATDTVRDESILETGEQPTFDTGTDAPAEQARREFQQRAASNPDELIEAVAADEGVLLRSESARLSDDVEAGRGTFELPGLFTSADAPPLRADLGDSGMSSRTTLRLPRPSDFTSDRDRFSAFPGDDIETLPDRAAESGRRRNPETGELEPDPTTAGSRFLTDEAGEGTAFVRATGDRTPELEAVLPPGTDFSRQGAGIIRLPDGDTADLDIFRRPVDRERRVSGGLGVVRPDSGDTGTVTVRELARRRRRDSTDAPGEPAGVLPGSSGGPLTDSDPTTTPAPSLGGTETPGATDATGSDGAAGTFGPSGGSATGPGADGPSAGTPPAGGSSTTGGGGGSRRDGGGGGGGGGFTFTTTGNPTGGTPTTGTPSIPGDTPRPRGNIDLFESEREEEDRLPRLLRRDDTFSSGFVSGAELLDLSGIEDT